MLKIILLTIISLIPSTVSGDSSLKKEIAICAAKEKDAQRLICYDKIAKDLGVDGPKIEKVTGAGDWHVKKEISPIDDSTNVYIYVYSEDTVQSGYKSLRPKLYVRCKENKTSVFLVWGEFLGLDSTKMLTRFDDKPASTDVWSISTDHKAVFVRDSDIAFAKKIMKHSKLLAQITPHSESPIMVTFNIDGLQKAIKPLRKACHW